MRVYLVGLIAFAIVAMPANASQVTIGHNGINSAGLLGVNGMPLTGAGIAIGQVEPNRPGRRVADGGPDDNAHSDASIKPTALFFGNTVDTTPNTHVTGHPQDVAGVMISTDATRTGVATGAMLYSSATSQAVLDQAGYAQSAQHVATRNGGDVRAINMSFGLPLQGSDLDGNNLLTQFIDWSASHHDVLYVVAGNEGTMIPIPTDNYNGIVVGSSTLVGGVYRQVSDFNSYDEQPPGDRKVVSILAPGEDVDMVRFNGASTPPDENDGTSFAAPHVTGTVALLQQYAEQKIAAPTPRWDADARRHEVMKAVLLNSADKILDNGTAVVNGNTVPQGYLLGMERTVLDYGPNHDGINPQNWLQSEAYGDTPFSAESFLALDDQMGAGHLNTGRARTQFDPGKFTNTGTATIPTIGWSYSQTDGTNDLRKFAFADALQGGSFVSITLAWDRVVLFNDEGGTAGEYDIGDTFDPWTDNTPPADDVINDLDLYLVPAGATSTDDAIAASLSNDSTIEHLFFQIPTTGNYEFWVEQFDAEFGAQPFAAAWWARPATLVLPPGDYNGDQVVDAQDYNVWRGGFGTTVTTPGSGADGNGNGIIDAGDYVVWRNQLGAGSGASLASVPELNGLALFAIIGVVAACQRGRRQMGSRQSTRLGSARRTWTRQPSLAARPHWRSQWHPERKLVLGL